MVTLCYAAQRGICITVVLQTTPSWKPWMRGAVLHLYQDGDRELHEVSLSRGFLNLERLLIPIWTIRQSYAPTGTYHNCTKTGGKMHCSILYICGLPFCLFDSMACAYSITRPSCNSNCITTATCLFMYCTLSFLSVSLLQLILAICPAL